MNPLMFKSREYKFSWPSLFGQDDWILASFFFYFFLDWEFVSVPKNVKKKKKLGQYPAILTSRLFNNNNNNKFDTDIAQNSL